MTIGIALEIHVRTKAFIISKMCSIKLCSAIHKLIYNLLCEIRN
jgi:hypothetical protein